MLISTNLSRLTPKEAAVAPIPRVAASTTNLPKPKGSYTPSLDSDFSALCECIQNNMSHWPPGLSTSVANQAIRDSQATLFVPDLKIIAKKIAKDKTGISERNIFLFDTIVTQILTECSSTLPAVKVYTDLYTDLRWLEYQKEDENYEIASHICKGGSYKFKGKTNISGGLPDALKKLVWQYVSPNVWNSHNEFISELPRIRLTIAKCKDKGLNLLAAWIKNPKCYESDLYKQVTLKERLELATKPHLLKGMAFRSIRFSEVRLLDNQPSFSDQCNANDYNSHLLHLLDAADVNDTKGLKNKFKTRLNLVAQACANARNVFLWGQEEDVSLIMRVRPKLSNLFLHERLLTLCMSNDDIGLKLLARCLEVPNSFDQNAKSFTLLPSRIDKLISFLKDKAVLDFNKATRLTLDILERMDLSDKNFRILANTVNAKVEYEGKVKQALREIQADGRFWGENLFSLLLPEIKHHLADPNWLGLEEPPEREEPNELENLLQQLENNFAILDRSNSDSSLSS